MSARFVRHDETALLREIGRQCTIDSEIPARITGVAFFDDGSTQMRVSWWNNGSLNHEWLAVDRVTVQP